MPKRGGKARRKRPTENENDRDNRQPKQAAPPAGNHLLFDWAGICGSGQDFVDTACLLSLLCTQLRDDTEDESDDENDVHEENEQDEISDEDLAPWDSQIRDKRDEGQLHMARSRLRNRFLDRLTEVLARVKGEPDEVASAYMTEAEDHEGNQRVEIRVAKNGGLSEDDSRYLVDIGIHLERVARGGKLAIHKILLR